MPKIRNIHKLLNPEIRTKNLRELGYLAKGIYWDVARPEVPDPIFVVGCSRSGTTITYEAIATSPDLVAFGYEIPQFWNGLWGPALNGWESEAAGVEHAQPGHRDAAFRFFYQRLGSGWVLDKTCINVMRIPYLHALFPNARFVYIHRDGRDNISSLMDGWRKDDHFALTKFHGEFPCEVEIDEGRFREWRFFLPPGWRGYNHSTLEEVCAFQWQSANRMALDAKSEIPPDQWIQVRYEDIFTDPVGMFERIFNRLGIPFVDKVRAFCATISNRPTSIVAGAPAPAKWKTHNRQAVERILDRISPLMHELGYEEEDDVCRDCGSDNDRKV